jgi:hypothetical protein
MMDLYTMFFEYKGGTFVSQVKAGSPKGALRMWARQIAIKVDGLGESSKAELLEDEEFLKPEPLDGLRNTWCSSTLIRGQLALIHFTKTKNTE